MRLRSDDGAMVTAKNKQTRDRRARGGGGGVIGWGVAGGVAGGVGDPFGNPPKAPEGDWRSLCGKRVAAQGTALTSLAELPA